MSKFDGYTNAIDKWQNGLRDGLPIGLAYFAIAFAFGMLAAKYKMSMFDTILMSATNITSAGQFTAVALIPTGISYLEMAMTQVILNLRYIIMSCSLSQKYDSDLPLKHRCITSFAITDEIFGLVCCQPGKVSPFYTYGIMCMTLPSWIIGTACGCYSGSLLPKALISTLGIVVYALFVAIIVPPSKHDPVIKKVCIWSILISYALGSLKCLESIQSGFKILFVTFLVAGVAAKLCPVTDDVATATEKATKKAHKEAMEEFDEEDDYE